MRISEIPGDFCYKSQLTVSFRNYIGSMQIKRELVVQQDSQIAKTIGSLKNDVIYNIIVHNRSSYSIERHNYTFGYTQRHTVPSTPINKHIQQGLQTNAVFHCAYDKVQLKIVSICKPATMP